MGQFKEKITGSRVLGFAKSIAAHPVTSVVAGGIIGGIMTAGSPLGFVIGALAGFAANKIGKKSIKMAKAKLFGGKRGDKESDEVPEKSKEQDTTIEHGGASELKTPPSGKDVIPDSTVHESKSVAADQRSKERNIPR